MFENIKNIFKRNKKKELLKSSSKDTAKERLHLVLMQDRANVSADFLDLMRQEIREVIKKYIDIDEEARDVRLGAETNEDGTQGAPALYANIPIINIKDETRKLSKTNQEKKIIVEENHKIQINIENNEIKVEENKKNEEKIENKEQVKANEAKIDKKDTKNGAEKKKQDEIKRQEDTKTEKKQSNKTIEKSEEIKKEKNNIEEEKKDEE